MSFCYVNMERANSLSKASVALSLMLFLFLTSSSFALATPNRDHFTFELAQDNVQPIASANLIIIFENDGQTTLRDPWALPSVAQVERNIKARAASPRLADYEPISKRSIVQGGGGAHVPSSSGSTSHATFNHPSTNSASAGGMHDKWPNGEDGAPKNLGALHQRQRSLYDRPPIVPTEPIPLIPVAHVPSSSPSPSPAPAPSPQAGNEDKLHTGSKRVVPKRPVPKKKSAASSSDTGRAAAVAGLAAGATALALHQGGTGQNKDRKNNKGGYRGRKIDKSRLRQSNNVKRSLQSYDAVAPTASTGATYVPPMNHRSSTTSSIDLFGYWPNGERGAPITFPDREKAKGQDMGPTNSHGSGLQPRHVAIGVLTCATGIQCYRVAKIARQTGSRLRISGLEQAQQRTGPRRGRRINATTGANELVKRENYMTLIE
ncbi:uncharacterized protein FA14DRAFT_153378 [Meira miltonrushii]|uniref:Uncharacterized protein n=1 Tax=Meira miltonrushii TaxID=1280837 RepID=A0A316VK28_9BASI|nr:uncharacterized protein FA14DRAFT_153378 [Meira miltonrushii]PWN38037.1 hypothetical protein FA14DRAFT_153378 [Meira miltonrushii]